MRWVRVVVLVCLLAALPGCGRFARSGAKGPSTTDAVDVAVGDDVSVASSTSTTAAPTTTTSRPTATTKPGARTSTTPPGPANVAAKQDPSGFRLTLKIDGQLSYGSTEDILMQVDVDNVSKQTLHWDTNALSHFFWSSNETSASWRDSDCRASSAADETPAATIDPGERLTFQATYPAAPERSGRERCRKKAGTYQVFGRIEWCPPGTINADNMCERGTTREVRSAPVTITIT